MDCCGCLGRSQCGSRVRGCPVAEPATIKGPTLEALGGGKSAAIAAAVAEKILLAISNPFSIQGNDVRSGASVGVAVYGPDAADGETMLRRADEALYRAKSEGRGTYRFFTDAMDTEVRARVCLNRELREAIAADQLFLLYQPQVDIDSGRIVGLEALVRWHHPTRGDLGPGMFIAAAEANGLIVPLERWVMREACRQIRLWSDAGIAPRSVAINVSGVQFKAPLELEQSIAAALTEFALPAQRLELELTESVLMQVSREHNEVLLRLRKQGIHVAIDDFGTGYSSLDYLRRYPVDRIKIAQTFMADIGTALEDDAIVKAALGLARELGIQTIAEGVETAAQAALLKAWGCRFVQGFYFSEPLSAVEVTRLLRIGTIAPARPDHQVELAANGVIRPGAAPCMPGRCRTRTVR
jgi:predicted signal transduction protein with EAL and GGDEF domain